MVNCPFCGNEESKVTDKRDSSGVTRRRRECLKCQKRFTTHEKIEPVGIIVIKKNGSREPYNRDKVLLGMIKACEKRPVPHEKVEHAINDIEELLRKKGKEIKSNLIGELVMKKLKKIDKVAYIRFASVYRQFADVEDFKKELKELVKR